MKPRHCLAASEIRWHLVDDLDLRAMLNSSDPEVAAAAGDEQQRRDQLAGRARRQSDDGDCSELF